MLMHAWTALLKHIRVLDVSLTKPLQRWRSRAFVNVISNWIGSITWTRLKEGTVDEKSTSWRPFVVQGILSWSFFLFLLSKLVTQFPQSTPPRGGTWVTFCWVLAAGLSEPLFYIMWPIIDPILVIFGQICDFQDPNLVTFYYYELTHFLDWMKNTVLLFIYSTLILVRLLTILRRTVLPSKIRKCATPF